MSVSGKDLMELLSELNRVEFSYKNGQTLFQGKKIDNYLNANIQTMQEMNSLIVLMFREVIEENTGLRSKIMSLEQQVSDLKKIKEDLQAFRELCEAQDRNGEEFQNWTRSRFEQQEERFAGIEEREAWTRERFEGQDKRFAGIEEREAWTRERFEGQDKRFAGIEEREAWTRERFEGQDKRFAGIEEREVWTRERFEGQDKRFAGIEEREVWTRERFEGHDKRFEAIEERENWKME